MNKKTTHSTLQLWLILASIPLIILFTVYILGSFAFNDDSIIEIDPSQSKSDITSIPELEINDLDKDFSAPLDNPSNANYQENSHSPSVLSDIKSFENEQSLTQMLLKKNENLLLDSNGHPMIVRVHENENLKVLAKRHLGDSVFWSYIYLVNKEKLNTPDAIMAGMTLYLPDSIYYDINNLDSLSIKKAYSLGKALK